LILCTGHRRRLAAVTSLALLAYSPASSVAAKDDGLAGMGPGPRQPIARQARRNRLRCRLLTVDDHVWTSFLSQTPHDFYHLPSYVALEAIRESGQPLALLVEGNGARLLLPLVIRPIPGGGHDATSPYGYPGPLVSGTDDPSFLHDAMAAGSRFLASEGIVSVFVRLHPLLNPVPPDGVGTVVRHGETVSIDLWRPTEVIWRQTRHDHRREITRALAAGHRVSIGRWDPHFEAFKHQYRATMERVGAAPRYLFGDAYFEELRGALGERLHLATVEVDAPSPPPACTLKPAASCKLILP
jgi:hypothetical protein